MAILVKHILEHASGRRSYRRAYPASLRPFIPNSSNQLKVSLGVEGSPGFLSRYENAAAHYDRVIAKAKRLAEERYDVLDAPLIAYLAEAFRSEELRSDDEERWLGSERDSFLSAGNALRDAGATVGRPWAGKEGQRWSAKSRSTSAESLDFYRAIRGAGDIDSMVVVWKDDAFDLLDAHSIVPSPDALPALRQLCRALNDAAIDIAETKLKRLDGLDVPSPSEPNFPSTFAAKPAEPRNEVALLDLYDAYAKVQGIKAQISCEWRRALVALTDFLGHSDAARLTADAVADWRDDLLEAVTGRGTKRDPLTVKNKYLTPLRATLNWAVEERKLQVNVAAGIVVRVPKKAKLRERDFTDAEALHILAATLTPPSGKMAGKYALARRWVPWLCAYTGARVNEISQLRSEDVCQIDGVWTIRITPEAGTVKSGQARTIPLHSDLVAQGFPKVAESASGPIFYDASAQRSVAPGNRLFKKVGERLAEWVRTDLGITDPGVSPNHAWRHTFKTRARESGMQDTVSDAITGHAAKTVGQTYGSVSLATKVAAIERMPRFRVATVGEHGGA